MALALKVENLSKAYQLGEIGTGTISRDIERWFAGIRGKEDPYLKIGEANERAKKGDNNVVWSLKDIDFEIEQGDAVGIIGRNGAGKSTLLKILSRITSPTTGRIRGNGRIASLLEVGTGFNPELTGRENIFLNGAILGMRKAEIIKHFDAIVDFAGVERYIDTPVKRYSSGMYVRLAFAVAAHLESEILIVDEVLAVGDAEFQKKCLGKMGDVSKGEGRTILFVSHNIGAVKELCKKGILLDEGKMKGIGGITSVTNTYLKQITGRAMKFDDFIGSLTTHLIFKEIKINGKPISEQELLPSASINIDITIECLKPVPAFRTSLSVFKDGIRIFTIHDLTVPEGVNVGKFQSCFIIPANLLRSGQYLISVGGHDGNHLTTGKDWIFGVDVASFTIVEHYSSDNDFANVGLINIPHLNKRIKA